METLPEAASACIPDTIDFAFGLERFARQDKAWRKRKLEEEEKARKE